MCYVNTVVTVKCQQQHFQLIKVKTITCNLFIFPILVYYIFILHRVYLPQRFLQKLIHKPINNSLRIKLNNVLNCIGNLDKNNGKRIKLSKDTITVVSSENIKSLENTIERTDTISITTKKKFKHSQKHKYHKHCTLKAIKLKNKKYRKMCKRLSLNFF